MSKHAASMGIVLVLSASVMSACTTGGSKPSDSSIEESIRQHLPDRDRGVLQQQSRERAGSTFEILSVEKSDGKTSQNGLYTADFSATIRGLVKCSMLKRSDSRRWYMEGVGEQCIYDVDGYKKTSYNTHVFASGVEVRINGEAVFEKKESGWSLASISFEPVLPK